MNESGRASHLHDRVLKVAGSVSWLPALLARITLFAIFAPTGWGKLQNLAKVTGYFTDLGIPAPHVSAVLVATSELVCAILLLVGLFTHLAALPLLLDMIVAIALAKRAEIHGAFDVFGFEEFLYIVILVWLVVTGPGRVSLDAWVSKRLEAHAS